MNSRRASDISKIAFSMLCGMILVVGLVAWRTRGNALALGVTASLPFGLLLFWSLFTVKMSHMRNAQNQAQVKRSIRPVIPTVLAEPPIEITFGLNINDNPLAPIASTQVERRVLSPKPNNAAKERLLTGRSPLDEDKSMHDQWHD